MRQETNKLPIKFYVLVASIFLAIWLLTDLANYPETFGQRVLNNIWRLVYVTVLNYFLFEYTIPYITRKRKTIILNILAGIIMAFAYMMLYSWGLYGWRLAGIGMGVYTSLINFNSTKSGVSQQMTYSVMSLFFFGIIRHIYKYIKLKQSAQQLRIEKQVAELNYLKAQTNPHFLFNTLNNIYSLARSKSDLAPESILRLSKILRFMLYETSGHYIAIEQEIKIIEDYIDLEKLRYDESLSVNFSYDVKNLKQAIPPLLLVPLVENAFKHGVSETRGFPFVEIFLSVKDYVLTFTVKNSSEAIPGESVRENIGLSNLRRQLELLYSDHQLSVKQSEGYFIASLKINLGSHV